MSAIAIAIICSAVVIGLFLHSGLREIAKAIAVRRLDVNLPEIFIRNVK